MDFGNLLKILMAGGAAYLGYKVYKQIPRFPNGKIPKSFEDVQDLTQIKTEKFLTDYYSWSYEPTEIEKSLAKIFSLFHDFLKQSTASSTFSENIYYKLSASDYKEMLDEYESNRGKYEKIINDIYNAYPHLFRVRLSIFDEDKVYHYFDFDFYKNILSPVFKTSELGNYLQLGMNESNSTPIKILSINFDTIFLNYNEHKLREDRFGLTREKALKKYLIERIAKSVLPENVIKNMLGEGLENLPDDVKSEIEGNTLIDIAEYDKFSEISVLINELKVLMSGKQTNVLFQKDENDLNNLKELILTTYNSQDKNQDFVKWSWVIDYLISDYILYGEGLQEGMKSGEEERIKKALKIENDLYLNDKYISYTYPYVQLNQETKITNKEGKEVVIPPPKNIYKKILENKDIFGNYIYAINENIYKIIKIFIYKKQNPTI